MDEVGGPDEDSTHFQKRSIRGWSQANYQRHIAKHHAGFAQETADAIQRLIDGHKAERVILVGDEVALAPLQAAPNGPHEGARRRGPARGHPGTA